MLKTPVIRTKKQALVGPLKWKPAVSSHKRFPLDPEVSETILLINKCTPVLKVCLYICAAKQDSTTVKIASLLTALHFQQIKRGTTDNLHNEATWCEIIPGFHSLQEQLC